MNNGVVMIPSCDMIPFQEAVDVGDAGAEVVVPRPSKTTTQTKEETIAVRAANREAERDVQKTIIAVEAANIKRQFLCVVVFGILMLFTTLALAVIAFATPEWRVYEVKDAFDPNLNPVIFPCRMDASVSTCQFTHTRRRGLFATCYSKPGFLTQVYASSAFTLPYTNGEQCVWELKYNIQNTPIVITNNCDQDPNSESSSLADLNTNLMRAQWMCFALAILLLATSLVLSIVSFCCIRVLGLILAGIMTLFATFLLVAGMGLFHGYIHIEEDMLQCPPFYATLKKSIYSSLYNNTNVSFGYSFWLGWVSASTSVVACAFLLGAACKRRAAMGIINKAMDRLRDLSKDEKIDKKYEAVQEKIRRKEAQMEVKMGEKQLKKMNKGGFIAPPMQQTMAVDPRRSGPQFNMNANMAMPGNFGMDQIEREDKYAMFEEKSEERLRMIEQKMRSELEEEKRKLEIEKQRVIEAAKKRERRQGGEERQGRHKKPNRIGKWLGRVKKPVKKEYYSDESSYLSDDEYDNRYQRRSNSMEGRRNQCTLPAPPVGLFNNNMGICSDPYTLHLPTGVNRY